MALLLIPVFLLAMYMLVVLPQQRRVRAHDEVVRALEPGQEVMTTSGVYGTLVSVEDEHVLLEIAPDVHIKIARASVGLVVTDETKENDAVGTDAELATPETPETAEN